MSQIKIILDTNTVVAAEFNADSDSAQIIQEVERGQLQMVWNEETREETERVLRQIPIVHLFALRAVFSSTWWHQVGK